MPVVGNKHFPYTKAGISDAAEAAGIPRVQVNKQPVENKLTGLQRAASVASPKAQGLVRALAKTKQVQTSDGIMPIRLKRPVKSQGRAPNALI